MMTSLPVPRRSLGRRAQAGSWKLSQNLPPALAILFCVALGVLLTWPQTLDVWRHGSFDDPDDAMRLVEVRTLLAGQNWFDMTAYRIAPPDGSTLHWSRTVDIPIAMLIKAFSLFTEPQSAERLARLSFPLLLQYCFYAAMARLAFLMIGRDAIGFTIAAVFLSGLMLGQFRPGRIDHHAPQMLLLVLMLCAVIDGIQKHNARSGWLTALCMALSLSISLENLPFLLVAFALITVLWIWNGDAYKPLLKGLGQGLAITLPACYLLTIGPQYWLQSFPDAFSFGHLIGGLLTALFSLLASSLPPLTKFQRAFVSIGSGLITIGGIYLLGSGVLHEPFHDLDPLLRLEWLRNVREAWYFSRLMQEAPDAALIFMAPLAFSLAGLGLALIVDKTHRAEWAILFSIVAVAMLTGLWLVRVLGVIAPLASLGGVWLATHLFRRIASPLAIPAALALLLPFTSIPWALAVTSDKDDANTTQACLAASGFEALAHLPKGLILAPIDYGAHVLAFTEHDVLAAPYHRNNHGNRLALTALLASPENAERIVRDSKARYVVVCSALKQDKLKNDLWHQLAEGEAPYWLKEIPLSQTQLKVYAISP